MSNDATPVRNLGPSPGSRKPLGQDIVTLFLSEGIGVVVAVRGEGTIQRYSLEEAERRGFIEVHQERDALFGVVSSTTIKIKSSRVRLALFPKSV